MRYKSNKLTDIFGIDLRTLALFRILLAGTILLDLLTRSYDLTAHYTDFGVLSRNVLLDYLSPSTFSLHLMNGTMPFQAGLFLLAAIIAIFLAIGWHTKVMTILSWLLMLSLQNRNVLILSGEDNLMLLMTFWAMFLPLGAKYSLDNALNRNSDKISNRFISFASAAILIQGMSMYFFSALLKTDARWIPDGTAVYFALQLDYLVTPFAIWFRQFEALLTPLTYYVWILEFIGPILIFSPILQRKLRILCLLAFITMHTGFFLFLEIGLFPLISIVMNLLFLPSWVWDKLAQRVSPKPRLPLIIWYDQDCGFCLKMVRFLRVFLMLDHAEIKPAQIQEDTRQLMATHNSWIVQLDGEYALKWNAMVDLVSQSPLFRYLSTPMKLTFIGRIGDRVYDWVADHRSTLSKYSNRWLPFHDRTMAPGVTGQVLAVIFIGFVTVQNISTLPNVGLTLSQEFKSLRQSLGLYQNWTMFAPYPELDSPWPIIAGELRDETLVDVYNKTFEPPVFIKPDIVSKAYSSSRWRKYLSNMEDRSYEDGPYVMSLNYGRYLCRIWNENAEEQKQLITFRIYFNVERTQPSGIPKLLDRRQIWEHFCF
jgi:predicted DCC family thiol-disulfide oxidoreductase YuxK